MSSSSRIAALLLPLALALLASSCGGNQPPRRSSDPAPAAQPVPAPAIPRTRPPQVAAESAIVIDQLSGRVLFAKNADVMRPVASTQKIVTAMAVLEAGSLDKRVVIQASDGHVERTRLDLKPGEIYTRGYLLKALMVKSGNDVARALARDVAGSQEAFAAVMNRRAKRMGMRRSNFVNPHGLTEPGQYSTARDIAIAARAAYREPTIRSFSRIKKYTFQYSDGRAKELVATNKLLKTVPFCDGMKTGTTNASGRCLAATGSVNGRAVVVVVLKSTSREVWNDSEKLLRWALRMPKPQAAPNA